MLLQHETLLFWIGLVANFLKCVQLVPQLLQNMQLYRRVKGLYILSDDTVADELILIFSQIKGVNFNFLVLNNCSIALMLIQATVAFTEGLYMLLPSLVGNGFGLMVSAGASSNNSTRFPQAMSVETWLWLNEVLSVVVNKVSTAGALELLFTGVGAAFVLNLLFMAVVLPFLRTLRQIVSSALFLCMLAVTFGGIWWLKSSADDIAEHLRKTAEAHPSPPVPEEPLGLVAVVCQWASSQWPFASQHAEL